MLNRDIQNLELNIYDIESSQTLQGRLDMDLLSKTGLNNIAENLMQSGMIVDTLQQIATNDTVGIQDFFSNTEQFNTSYEALKKAIALAEAHNNSQMNTEYDRRDHSIYCVNMKIT